MQRGWLQRFRLLTLLLTTGLMLGAPQAARAATDAAAAPPPGLSEAIFAGGCFWCLEAAFDGVEGVVSATSGYTGGSQPNPSYQQVAGHETGHVEAVRVLFDARRTSYARLLEVFWRNIDPTDAGGQFCDRGSPYRSAIFTVGAEQAREAEASRQAIVASGRLNKPVVTEIRVAAPFYIAEDDHQDYHEKNPLRYRSYRAGCGRDRRLEQLWGKAR